ncbi:PilW family protein [Archangium lipolyticum]|uniref:PilW family protein n=1 Tax=Archangium lipolyticum TaxID=2970465 RepID=UPI00214A2DF1|nr:PilW family protein [Archangium lipolyticum]
MAHSKSPLAHAPRGFTLVELLVGAATTTIILAAVAAAFVGVQGAFQRESRVKVAVEGLRTATGFIEQRLRMAGYGVEPRFAFDFNGDALPSGAKSNHVLAFGGSVPNSVTDDLAFRYRDAAWMRRGHLAGTTVVLEDTKSTFGMSFSKGQRLLVSCVGGKDYVVMRAGESGVSGEGNTASNFILDEALSTVPIDAPCLTRAGNNSPYLMLIHELRIRIVDLDGRPFLMAFQGLDELDMSSAVPLAADVESFQVAYVMNRPAPGSPNAGAQPVDFSSPVSNWVLGDIGSADADRVPDPDTAPVPLFKLPYEDPARYNRHPANIRAVRLSIGIRSTSPEPNGRRAFERVELEDSGEAGPADGYYRTNMTTTVRVPNMLSRSTFNPPVGDESSGLNVWGG